MSRHAVRDADIPVIIIEVDAVLGEVIVDGQFCVAVFVDSGQCLDSGDIKDETSHLCGEVCVPDRHVFKFAVSELVDQYEGDCFCIFCGQAPGI